MIKKLIISAVFFFSIIANASIDGSWIGWAYWSFDGSPVKCDSAMKFRQSETHLERVSGQFECGIIAMEVNPKQWTLKDGKIFEQHEPVGSYEENKASWSENYSETVKIETEIAVNARHMDYFEKWVRKNDKSVIYEIKGRLFLQD